eukprot:5260755-Pleurochrysis_carterae.AAC.1
MHVAYGGHEPQRTVAGMQEDWRGHVTTVGGMFEEVFSAGVSSGAEQDVRQSGDVIAVADRRWPTIGYVRFEESGDGEGRTRG